MRALVREGGVEPPMRGPKPRRLPLAYTHNFQCPSFPQHHLAPFAASVLEVDPLLPSGTGRGT